MTDEQFEHGEPFSDDAFMVMALDAEDADADADEVLLDFSAADVDDPSVVALDDFVDQDEFVDGHPDDPAGLDAPAREPAG